MFRFLLFAFFFAATSVHATEKPNVVFIMVDDLGFGDLSSHGAKDMRTPHIDKLMADGVRFDNAYANCPVCSPTRASFLTGRYPDMVGVPGVIRTFRKDNWGNLDTDVPTIAQTFRKAGYQTALIGKWHLGLEGDAIPTRRGFDYFKGWLGDMMDDYYLHRRHDVPYMREGEKLIKPEGHATDLFAEWSSQYLDERAKLKDGPFFLFLSFNAPHTPIQPPDNELAKVLKREKGITEKRAKLVALIEHLDSGIGKVLDTLNANKLGETIIVFTSDNGGQMNVGANNGANRGGKQEMWEGGLRVPTCVVWPGKTKPGTRLDSVTVTMDWLPTLAEAAGIDVPEGLDGRSILPDILGKGKVDSLRPLVWVRREGGLKYGGRVYYAIRKREWKLLQNTPYEPMTLFNLSKDPMEQSPVTNQPAIYNELSNALRKHINASGPDPLAAGRMIPTAERRQAAREPNDRSAVMFQTWRHLLFLHWKVDPALIQAMLPAGLTVDLFEDEAYVGIVPFFMCDVRPRFLPCFAGLSNFLELNVRTYVHDADGVPGVWFFSLDANCAPAVWAARTFFNLPYRHASMQADVLADGAVEYSSVCQSGFYEGDFRYEPQGSIGEARAGSLEFFLLERYYLYSYDKKRQRLFRGQVAHEPYQFSEAKVSEFDIEVMTKQGLIPINFDDDGDSISYDHACIAQDVDVKILGLERL